MPPKKGNKMSLNDFLADETTGSWADDVDDLPIAPQPREGRYPGDSARRGGDYLASMPDRVDRDRMGSAGPLATPYGGAGDRGPPRQDVPLPDKPPFTAFLGSLSFDVTEGDIADFFAPHNPVTVRIVADRDGKPKGFGYIEFESLDALKDALSRSGAPLAGRPVRVGVAEPPKSTGDRPGFGPSAAEEASQWRRAGPLPPSSNDGPSSRPGMGSRERSTGGFGGPRDGPSGFDNMEVGAGGRSGFGSKFQSSPSGPGAQGRAGPPPPREPLEPSKGEVASDWRTGKPMEGRPSRPAFQGRGGEEGSSRSPSFRQHREATDVDEKYAGQERMGFGSKFVATPPDSPSTGRGPGGQRRGSGQQHGGAGGAGDSADTWRSARSGGKPAGATSPLGGNASASPAPPAERKKLDLKPRGSSTTTEATTAAEAATSSRASPFGNAKPVDSSEREKAIEERIRKEREQRAAEEAARRAEREKATKDAPSGPRADRAKAASAGVTGEAKSTANDGNKDIPATTEVSPAPAAAAAAAAASSTPKSPPPTGAWGGGRAASGALAAKQQQEKATNGDTSTADLAKGVEGVKVSGAEDDKTDA